MGRLSNTGSDCGHVIVIIDRAFPQTAYGAHLHDRTHLFA